MDQLSDYVQTEMRSMSNAINRMEAIITHQSRKKQPQTVDINYVLDDDGEEMSSLNV